MKLPISTFVSLLLIGFAGGAYGQVETINYSDGGIYVGEVRNGIPDGQGAYTYPDGVTRNGIWGNGRLMQQNDIAATPAVGSRPDAACFAFMILTVARPSEVRLVDWKEIDLDEKLWTVPAGTHKSSEEWKIPLCPQAMKILKAQPTRKGRVFSTLNNKEIPDAYLSSTPDALGFDAVAYGFRSTFRTWGQEQVKSSEEALELSLKHLEASATRAAYARSQLFYERRRILNAYELWCFKGDAGQSNKVIDLPKRRKLANA
jgi:hypothetical protein